MKYLLVILVVLAVLWLARAGRRRAAPPRRPPPPARGEPMVVCAHCGVHLPRSEALPGRLGLYCGEAHRLAHEPKPPGS